MNKIFLPVFVIFSLLCHVAIAGSVYNFSQRDKQALDKALNYAKNGQFDKATSEASRAGDRDVLKIILWRQYQEKYGGNNYKEIADFMNANPDWPAMKKLRNSAEEALDESLPAKTVVSYFASKEPSVGNAMIVLAEAKMQLGYDEKEVNKLFRQGWIQGDFSKEREEEILQKHGSRLRDEDHIRRIDRLLWEDKIPTAKRLIGRVGDGYEVVFTTRILYMEKRRVPEGVINRIPKTLRADAGLLFERVLQEDQRENYKRVYEMLVNVKTTMPYQEQWWKVKSRLVRELLKNKNYQQAYAIAKNSGNTSGEDYAESEWLAGWISLEFLKDAASAYKHFHNVYDNVTFPVSKSRGEYWMARAATKNNDPEMARNWYLAAADNPTTFYGQLAYVKLHGKAPVAIAKITVQAADKEQVFKSNELLKCAYMLESVDEAKLAENFISAAIDSAKSQVEMAAISEFGKQVGRTELSVVAAKQALKKGVILSSHGWPVIENIPHIDAEKSLVLGIIRQESSFNPQAKSPADAYGLMQLLPATGKMMAKKLDINFNAHKLANDPLYNVQLGSRYISGLVEKFDGSYILAIASYNAGPTNVNRWIETYGDPRLLSSPDQVLNWMESIPFSETRNYVQRVLENVQVYRSKLKGEEAYSLEGDLLRGRMQVSGN
jgi:soluble lytic murein transglycosylase